MVIPKQIIDNFLSKFFTLSIRIKGFQNGKKKF